MLDTKSVQKVSKHSLYRPGKTDLRYWREAVFRPAVAKRSHVVPQYYVKIQYQGRRETFQLKTNSQDQAAEKAKGLYLALVAKGWDEVLKEEKPHKRGGKVSVATVGDLIAQALQRHDIGRKTLMDYARAFRLIVGQIAGECTTKCNASRKTLKERRARVDQTKLLDISPRSVEEWRQIKLKKATSQGPIAIRRTKNTLNSILRQAKSLFSPKFLRHLNLGEKIPNPFVGVNFEPRQSMRYHSQIDLEELIKAALHGDEKRELEKLPKEQLKAFLLAGLAGLRRNEIDKLEWSSFHWEVNSIQLIVTDFFRPKTEESLGEVIVDAELISLFREFHSQAKSSFVIDARPAPRVNVGYSSYRCQEVFDRLSAWLRKAGVPARTPIHTLRKEFGSLMCSKHGIYAASRALRHRDIYITSQHYVDNKQRVVPGLSAQLVV